jgi:hypothetical protein
MNLDTQRKNLIREELIGMNYEKAALIYNIRLVEIENEGQPITSDFNPNRINVSVVNNIIVKVEFY